MIYIILNVKSSSVLDLIDSFIFCLLSNSIRMSSLFVYLSIVSNKTNNQAIYKQ